MPAAKQIPLIAYLQNISAFHLLPPYFCSRSAASFIHLHLRPAPVCEIAPRFPSNLMLRSRLRLFAAALAISRKAISPRFTHAGIFLQKIFPHTPVPICGISNLPPVKFSLCHTRLQSISRTERLPIRAQFWYNAPVSFSQHRRKYE